MRPPKPRVDSRPIPGKHSLFGIFALVPLAFIAVYFWQRSWAGPAWLATNQDPNYAYLFNGLAFATGHLPAFCDNPGSPVFIFMAAMLRLLHPIASGEQLAALVVEQPEHYLALANHGLAVLFACVLGVGGWQVAKRAGSVSVGLLFQAVPLLLAQGTEALQGVRPEPFMIISGVGLAACLVCQGLKPAISSRQLWLWSLLLAIGMTSKVLFVPLMLPALAALPDWRSRGRLLLFTFIATAVVALPVWPCLGHFVSFIWNTLTHKGTYGGGDKGLPEWSIYCQNLVFLLKADKSYAVLLVLTALSLPLAASNNRRWMAAVLVAQLLSFMVIALHPSGRYLTASISLLGATVTMAALPIVGRGKVGWVCLGLILLPLAGYKALNLSNNKHLSVAISLERSQLSKALANEYPQALVLPYFQCSDPAFALYYGNETARWQFTKTLAPRLGNRLVYDRFDQQFHRGEKLVADAELRDSGQTFILTGWTLSEEDRHPIELGHKLKMAEVFHGWIESAYLVRWE